MTAIIRKDGSYWEPDTAQILKWQSLYPNVDVYQELNAMAGWCDANPAKRKTKMGQFCNSWLSRAQQNGGKSPFSPEKKQSATLATRDMTSLDDLSHNFIGDIEMRKHFIEKYGQCFENGVRYT
tara:strand:- start:9 stop:380 length:372 start_codon:yes stop_codon:yes gene_type:complete